MGAANKLLQAASGGASGDPVYVEDVFSTFLYAGDSSAGLRTIDNGLNLLDEGGLIWTKERNNQASLFLIDTERGLSGGYLKSNADDGANTSRVSESIDSFTTTGYKLDGGGTLWNRDSYNVVSWSFRKSTGFFDVVTYTGDGTSNRTISHNLACRPAMIWVKRTDSTANWQVWHRYSGLTYGVANLNTSDGWTNTGGDNAAFGSFVHSDTTFTLGAGSRLNDTNQNGATYVAYLFAGTGDSASQIFGENGDQGIIKCGSYTGNNSADGPTVTLGYEPQWLLIKESSASGNAWSIYDMMRNGTMDQHLRPNSDDKESIAASSPEVLPIATGFKLNTSSGRVNRSQTYIYAAIRRPMKAPDYGTDVFTPVTYSGNSSSQRLTSTGVADLAFLRRREGEDWVWSDRLSIGSGKKMRLNRSDDVENDPEGIKGFDHNDGIDIGDNSDANGSSYTFVAYMLTRATGFFDVVADTSTTSAARTVSHNLGVPPEIIISKRRDGDAYWLVMDATNYLRLNADSGDLGTPIMSNFTATGFDINAGTFSSGEKWVAYLFATLAGISKVGSYTGTGSDLNVDCGFSAGARFVLIKRTDSSGDWYIWDSARGIVAGNDPYVLANSNSAEVTNTDYIDPLSTGFTVTAAASSTVNVSSGTYIFLAIA